MSESERIEKAASLLDSWASAIRGDWSSIDGRSCRGELNRLTSYLRGDLADITAEDIGVCLRGGAHWFGESWDHECDKSA